MMVQQTIMQTQQRDQRLRIENRAIDDQLMRLLRRHQSQARTRRLGPKSEICVGVRSVA